MLIPNVLSQVLNAILTTSGKSYQSRQSHFHKNMSPVNQGMGVGALKGALSGVGCAAQTLPFKIFKSVHFAALFRDLRLWEHLLCFFMIFGFNKVFWSLRIAPPMWTARYQAMTAHTCLSGFKVHLPVCLPIEKVTTGVRHCSYLLQTIISVLLIQRSHWPRPTVNFSFTKLRWMKCPPKYSDFRGSYSVPSFLRKLNFTVIIILSSFKDNFCSLRNAVCFVMICITVYEKSSKVSSAFLMKNCWTLEFPWWSVPHKKLTARAPLVRLLVG